MPTAALDLYGAVTHEVINQPVELANYNLFSTDAALAEAVAREGANWASNDLADFGGRIGTAEYLDLGAQANRHLPEFDTHDRYGRRVDLVRFHPSYHQLMKTSIEEGLHSSPWTDPRKGAHVARAARVYMHSQVESGHGCPISMTFAAVPALNLQSDIAKEWLPKITARVYDPRNLPIDQKQGVTIGMAMTEKQGGSDVRANTTRAIPVSTGGPGREYELIGHKFFVSAPMCDAFLVLAQAPGGLSCFLVPRWRPDGTKNPLQVLRLKKKMGNASNASSETELRGALGWMIGKEGRGVATIIEMVAMTRFDCMIGSSALMRMALSQAIDHCGDNALFRQDAHRPADHAERAGRSRTRGRGGTLFDHAHCSRSRQSIRRNPRLSWWLLWRSHRQVLGSASARRASPTRQWNALGSSRRHGRQACARILPREPG